MELLRIKILTNTSGRCGEIGNFILTQFTGRLGEIPNIALKVLRISLTIPEGAGNFASLPGS